MGHTLVYDPAILWATLAEWNFLILERNKLFHMAFFLLSYVKAAHIEGLLNSRVHHL